jgi:conjugative relaxase-like TrwC/TraI family protein
VLRLHVVRGAGVDYHLTDLVPGGLDRDGRTDGTGVAGESPGAWTGRGSAALGLHGAVAGPDLAGVLAGRDPAGGVLRQAQGDRAVHGFDLVFAAPKAVSLLHLLAPRELAVAAGSAHAAAVADAVGYLEGAGLGVRRTRRGQVHRLGTTGAVAAGFVHRTSRALDPHLHSHVVTANVAQGVDGRWSTLDSRRLFLHRRAVQAVYDASLRHHLSRSAGVAWRRAPSGSWEVAGVDPVLCRLFSQRAASIDESSRWTSGGRGPVGGRRAAYFADRPDKDRTVTVDELRAAWTRRAAAMGIVLHDLVQVVGRTPPTGPGERISGPDVLRGLVRSTANRSPLATRDVVAAVADAAPQGLDPRDVVRVANAVESAVGPRPRDGRTWSGPGGSDDVVRALGADPSLVERALAEGSPHPAERMPVAPGPGRRSGRAVGGGPDRERHQPVDLGRWVR